MLEMKRTKQSKSVIWWSVKQKIWNELLVPSVEMCDQELVHLVHEIEDYKKSMEQAEKHMKSSTSAFMAAHSAMMEVLGVTGKVQYHQRFSSKGLRNMQMHVLYNGIWQSWSLEKTYHQLPLDSIWSYCEYCYTCCKFSYGNVIATVYACASICGFFIYENMSLSGRCHIVLFVYCRGRNRQFRDNMPVCKKKIRMRSWLEISPKDKQM